MRRNILFIVLLFAALTALSALQKPIFLLWYAELVADAEWSELLGVISNGLSLDMTMAGYVCAVPILLILLSIWYPHKLWGKMCRGWLYTASVIVAICFSVNLGLYEYWRFPLDGSIVQYLATPAEAMASALVYMNVSDAPVTLRCEEMLLPGCVQFRCEPATVGKGEEGRIVITYDPAADGKGRKEHIVVLKDMGLPPSQSSIKIKVE